MSVGVRELKANLSEYLARAAAGEEIVVTDRNRPVARLVAYSAASEVERGIDEGWIEAPHRTRLAEAAPVRSARSTIEVLDEDRGMTLYVDSSALLKRYIDEHDSGVAIELMGSDPVLVTSRLTEIEVRRNLTRLLDGEDLDRQRRAFSIDLDGFALVTLDATTMNAAVRIAEQTLCRSLDSIHLGAAQRAGSATVLLTFDVRQARSARDLGLTVLGV